MVHGKFNGKSPARTTQHMLSVSPTAPANVGTQITNVSTRITNVPITTRFPTITTTTTTPTTTTTTTTTSPARFPRDPLALLLSLIPLKTLTPRVGLRCQITSKASAHDAQ